MNKSANNEAITYLAYNVSYLRRKHNITKNDMAKILGIGIKSLNRIEQGILPPRLSVEILFNIREYFGIPLNILIGEKISDSIY